MNNAKFSNALVALADAVHSSTADYEAQIASLRQNAESVAKALAASTRERDNCIAIFQSVYAQLEEASRGVDIVLQHFSRRLLAELEKTPWMTPLPKRPSPDGSPGAPPSPPTSKANTPNG